MKNLLVVAQLMVVILAGCSREASQPGRVVSVDGKPSSLPAVPFDFRGIKLGITRSEFKAIAIPPVAKNAGMKSEPIATCSKDPQGRMKGSLYLKQGDTESNCWWEYDTGAKKGKPSWERYVQANVMVGDDEDKHYSFDFAALPEDPDHKLYRMTVHFPSRSWEGIVLALTEKFGVPVPGRQGYTLDSGSQIFTDTYTWRRDDSYVLAVKNVGLHNVGYVAYVLTKYSAYVYEQKHKNEASNGSGM